MPPIRNSRASAAPASSLTHPTSPASTSPSVNSSGRARKSNPTQTTTSASGPIACIKVQPASAPTRVERLPGGYVPNRPSNAWFVYRAHRVAQDQGGGQQQDLSKAYSVDWKNLSPDEKKPFYDVYRANDNLFHRRFPDYQYQKGKRNAWLAQATKYGVKVAHDWTPENDHLFVLDEDEAVVHTPCVIPITDSESPESPSTSPSLGADDAAPRTVDAYTPSSTSSPPSFQSAQMWDADLPASTYTQEAPTGTPQVVEYTSCDRHRIVHPACLLYQDFNEPLTRPELSTHFELIPSEDLDISALQFNSLNGYEPGEMPADPYDSEYYQPPGCASLWMPQYYHAE